MITLRSAPKLRDDVFVVPSGRQTAYIHSSRGIELIAEPGSYAWIERLTPFLNGASTVERLVTGLDDERRSAVLGVLARLDALGLIEDSADDGPARREQSFADADVLVLGAGQAADVLARHLNSVGVAKVAVSHDPDSVGHGHDAVVVLAGTGLPLPVTVLAGLDDRCRRNGVWFVPAAADDAACWIGPVLRPGATRLAGGWIGAWLRIHGQRGAAPARRPIEPVAVEIAAAQLVHRFRELATAEDDTRQDVLIRLDLNDLSTSRHSYRPHPAALPAAAQSESEFLASIAALRAAPAVDAQEFSRRAAQCIDERTGLIGSLDEEGLPQFPRRATTATVRDPRGAAPDDQPHRVYGVAPDFGTARILAARRALARYASLALDPRRFVPTGSGPAVWAWSPEREAATLVPASAVVPESVVVSSAKAVPGSRGLGHGLEWDEAVDTALRSLRGVPRHRALIVPLDHDPAAVEALPYLVKAVVIDA
ncbi:hypothetical protein KGQ19_29240 [Catenulispora sp. NL8]|uniref:Uncharacterized protein n=1 Tax=Catenulispora pinistramenti TaxID=2705254 RepID=A0ABS5KYE4_9ACTN|nr:hypothetical protein [Catenulispora pinistramenti]MBS2550965.1 hypothetical protein [Catenulispora pinistramenti]